MAITDGLVAYWKLDEASGFRYDSHAGGNTYRLDDINTVTQAAGKMGNAAQFTRANNEFLRMADSPGLSHGDFNFTWTAWIYLDTRPGSGTTRIVNKSRVALDSLDDWEIAWDVHGTSGNLSLLLGNGDGTNWKQFDNTSYGALSLGTWYWVLAAHDATNNFMYTMVNNGNLWSTPWSFGSYDGDGLLHIGGSVNSSDAFSGRIDGVGRWNRLLLQSEMDTIYNSGNGLEYPFTAGSPIKRLALMGVG